MDRRMMERSIKIVVAYEYLLPRVVDLLQRVQISSGRSPEKVLSVSLLCLVLTLCEVYFRFMAPAGDFKIMELEAARELFSHLDSAY